MSGTIANIGILHCKAKNTARLIGALTSRLRDTLFIMHQAVFFIGNAHYNMGDKEAEETAAYAEADALRKQVSRTGTLRGVLV